MNDRAIPVGRERTCLAIFAAAQHHDVSIGLEARTRHCEPREIAVSQKHGLCVPRRIVGCQVARLASAICSNFIEIKISRPGFLCVGNTRREYDALAVGAEGVILLAAERLRGHMATYGARDQFEFTDLAIAAERGGEEAR